MAVWPDLIPDSQHSLSSWLIEIDHSQLAMNFLELWLQWTLGKSANCFSVDMNGVQISPLSIFLLINVDQLQCIHSIMLHRIVSYTYGNLIALVKCHRTIILHPEFF